MSAAVSKQTEGPWAADLLKFAAARNLEGYLEPLLQAIHRVFPAARRIKAKLEEDLAVEDHWQVIFDVQAGEISANDARAGQKAWHQELVKICPSQLLPNFGLFLELQ